MAEFALARVLWDSKRSRKQAPKMAVAAQREWQKTPEQAREELAEGA